MTSKTGTTFIFFLVITGLVLSGTVFPAGGTTKKTAKEELQLHVVIKAASYVGIACV